MKHCWGHGQCKAKGGGKEATACGFFHSEVFCLQAPPKPMFTEREKNYANHRRLLYKYITDTRFLEALTTQELGCNLLSGANPSEA